MIHRILSHDLPRSRALSVALVLVLVLLAIEPFIFPGAKSLNVAAKMRCCAAGRQLRPAVATPHRHFAHTMFFGIGAYGVAMAARGVPARGHRLGPVLAGLAWHSCWRWPWPADRLFSLRVKAIFYAMITLAVAAAFQTSPRS